MHVTLWQYVYTLYVYLVLLMQPNEVRQILSNHLAIFPLNFIHNTSLLFSENLAVHKINRKL